MYSRTREEHYEKLRQVFSKLRGQQLYAQRSKCEFLASRLEYLGHLIDRDGVRMDPKKVVAIQSWPQPGSVADVQSFLGLASYYQRFVQGFAKVAAPLTSLLQKAKAWTWGNEEQVAFQQLKTALSMAPVLAYPDDKLPFVIAADASDLAVGAVLQQDQGKGLQPIAYFSRKLRGIELNWSTHEKEALAQGLALKEWRCYVEGASFVLETDHSPLCYLQTQPQLSRKQARWLEFFQQFTFEVR